MGIWLYLSVTKKNCENFRFGKLPFSVRSFSCAMIKNIHFQLFFFKVGQFIFVTHKFRPPHNSIVFVCIKLSTRSTINVFQNKSECKVGFGWAFELAEHMIQFFVEQRVDEGSHGKIEKTMSIILMVRVNEEAITRIEFFFYFCIIYIFWEGIPVRIGCLYRISMLNTSVFLIPHKNFVTHKNQRVPPIKF